MKKVGILKRLVRFIDPESPSCFKALDLIPYFDGRSSIEHSRYRELPECNGGVWHHEWSGGVCQLRLVNAAEQSTRSDPVHGRCYPPSLLAQYQEMIEELLGQKLVALLDIENQTFLILKSLALIKQFCTNSGTGYTDCSGLHKGYH